LTDVIEQTKKVRYSFTLADGRSFEIVATPLSNNDGTISKMVIIRNITEQKEQEQRRLEISQHKEQLTKLASLKTMAGAIAHRFNNAMVGVQGNLELLTLVLPGNSREHVMVRHAFQAAKGASQIGSMMLSYVGQQPLTPRELSLVEIAREVVADSKHLFHSAMDLRFFPTADPFYCLIDRRQIKEVIQNILTNAVESLGNGSGTIEITFGIDYFITALFPICFQDSNLEDGRYAFCQIKDSGHGVGAENLSKVFEPFYTSRFFGRGLGLALTVGIMQSHHGAITFESSPGIGTTVRILLPVFETRAEQTNPEIKKPESPQKQLSGDILLVDDESIVLEVGREILTRLGFTVDTAVNGREAVEKVRARGLDYRAIVMDISMPELNGIEAMKAIRKVHPTIPIVLSSGYSEGSFPVNEDERCRPDGFLGKPFQISDMQRNLEILLTGN
jgi:signal transduction histidine kinase/CheY-like chemotaxis protein